MLNALKIRAACFFLRAKGTVTDFGKDERGLSGVVVAILLILVAVLAIVLLWGFLGGWLNTLWGQITSNAETGLTTVATTV